MADDKNKEKGAKGDKAGGKAAGKDAPRPEGKGEPKPESKGRAAKAPTKSGPITFPTGDIPGLPPAPPPRLLVRYRAEIVPRLMQKLGIANRMAVPKVQKVVLNMGVGRAKETKRRLELAVRDLSIIAGQKAVTTKARNSVANFHLRKGMEIGCKVTLRGKRMYEFLDRLVCIAIPRIRDFRGLNPKSFDGRGNYSVGLTEQMLFPEVPFESAEIVHGMDVTIATTSRTDDGARALLGELGFPFRTN